MSVVAEIQELAKKMLSDVRFEGYGEGTNIEEMVVLTSCTEEQSEKFLETLNETYAPLSGQVYVEVKYSQAPDPSPPAI